MNNKYLLRVNGGLGKHICATALAKAIHNTNNNAIIDIESSYPEVFYNLPFIRRSYYNAPRPYSYDEHHDFEIIANEPYLLLDFRQKKSHVIDAFIKANNINIENYPKQGIINITQQEHNAIMQIVAQIPRNKKWIAFQPFGGNTIYGNNPNKIWGQCRDLPVEQAQAIVDYLNSKDCIVFQISLPYETRLQNTIILEGGRDQNNNILPLPIRLTFALLNLCDAFIGIDSFGQHAWAALNKNKALVIWGATAKENFGYDKFINIYNEKSSCIACSRPNLAFVDIVANNATWQCNNNQECMKYEFKQIQENIDKLLE